MIVPTTFMCPWGKAPEDKLELRYKKGAWWFVSPGLYLYVPC
jgi:hypothetical protein